jgi:hypothetical protein
MDSSAYDVALAGNTVAWIDVPMRRTTERGRRA